jgi:outer membrane protein assembly factor BamB
VRFVLAAAVLLTLLAASPPAHAKAVRPSGPVDAAHRTSYGQDADWTSYGHDAQLTNRVRSQSLGARTASRLALQWRTRLDSGVTASPLAATIDAGGITRTLVFVATWAGSVSALDAGTGSIVWTRTFGSVDTGACGEYGIASTPAIDVKRGRLYAIGADGLLRGLDLATGDDAPGFPIRLIDRTATEYVWGGLRIVQDRLYVPVASYCDAPDDAQIAADGRLIAIDLGSLAPAGTFDAVPGFGFLGGLWGWGGVSAEPDGSVVYSAVGNSSVYSADCDCLVDDGGYGDSVVALTPDLQTVLDWNRPATVPNVGDADFGAAPLLFQPDVCPPLAAANNKAGALYIWDRRALGAGPIATVGLGDATAPFVGAPSYDPVSGLIYDSQVFMTDSDTGRKYGVAALGPGTDCTFTIVWRAAFGSGSQAPPIVVGDVVLVGGGFDGGFAALDGSTGRLLWSYATDEPTLAPLISVGGSVFGADLDGNVYAFAVAPAS